MIFTKQMVKEFLAEELEKYNTAAKEEYTYKFKDKIRKAFFAFLGGRKQWIPPTSKIDGKTIKNIVIFRYDAIGDYFVTTSAIRWLKKAIPNVKIDMITSQRNHVIAENDPNINEAFPLKYSGNFSLSMFKIAKYRRMNHYDLTVALIFSKNTKSAIMASLVAPDSEKITVNHNRRSHIYGLVFNRLADVAIPGYTWAEKMVKCVSDNIEPVQPVDEKDTHPYIYIKEQTYNKLLPFIKEHKLHYELNTENIMFYGDNPDFYNKQSGHKYCVINIAGTEQNRIWDVKNVVEYCNELIKNYPDLKIFISGGPAYKDKVADIVNTVNSTNCLELNIGLLEFIAFCAGAYYVVTPDTGVVHIAAAANVPLIVLYVEKYKIKEWHPHNTKYVLLLTPNIESINFIPTEEMIDATQMLIKDIETKE